MAQKRQLSKEDAEYQEAVNIPPDITPFDLDKGGPIPPKPPAFRTDPVVPGKELAQLVAELLKLAPQLRGKIKSVTDGPTKGSIIKMLVSGLSPDAFAGTNLLGVELEGNIGINPAVMAGADEEDPKTVLAHEAAHTAGYGERDARYLGYLRKRKPK